MIRELSTLAFIERQENVILPGPGGAAKNHLAIALGDTPTRHGMKVRFPSVAGLILQLETVQIQGAYRQILRRYSLGPSLLLIDKDLPTSKDQAHLFFQVIAKRYGSGSVILTSKLSFGDWQENPVNDAALTHAMLDRLLHHAQVIRFRGQRYRLTEKMRAGHRHPGSPLAKGSRAEHQGPRVVDCVTLNSRLVCGGNDPISSTVVRNT